MALAAFTITPLELPEIRITIGKFLDRSDLVQCLYVCRAWHDSFLPLVWSTVSICSDTPRPNVEAFNQNSRFIRNLTYDVDSWGVYASTHCRDLSTLLVHCTWNEPPVIAQYDKLRDLSIQNIKQLRLDIFPLWRPSNSFQNLSSLTLEVVDIDPAGADDFWDQCTRLKSLSIIVSSIPRLPNKSMKFERLRKLRLMPRFGHLLELWQDFITQCPSLISLNWDCGRETSVAMDNFIAQLTKGTWPNLCELGLPSLSPSDKRLGQILNAMPQVESLVTNASTFGPLSLAALRPHFSILRELKMEWSTYPGTAPLAIPEILASCPQLEILVAGEVAAQNILQGQPWVCERTLKTLHFCVIISPGQDADHQQQHVLERISRLYNLENFGLLTGSGTTGQGITHINLQLGKGLEHLSALKKLRTLFLYSRSILMAETDVEWMLDNLKSLEHIHGFMNTKFRDNKPLAKMVQARKIQYRC
ncbi:MAG: hypothetical protein J3Q66DRAFT_65430 [Benniella sp.]|nr:MAG: hypothetical protein J3Q66DRAFT_65430 [Benniella sp.]